MIDPNMEKLGAILESWVVYRYPLDYPNSWVLRRQWAMKNGQVVAEVVPRAVTSSLEDARLRIPSNLVCLARSPKDAPSIYETWL